MHAKWVELSEGSDWSKAQAVATHQGRLWVVAGEGLYTVDPETGAWEQRGDGTWRTQQLASTGESLFAFEQDGSLYRVTDEGGWEPLDGDWSGTTAAVGHGGRLYAAQGGAIYAVEADGAYQAVESGTSWSSRGLYSVGNVLVSLETSGGLYRLDPQSGAWAEVNDESWSSTTAAVGHRGRLWAIAGNGELYVVHPVEAGWEEVPSGTTWNTAHLAAVDGPGGGALYAFEKTGGLYRIVVEAGAEPTTDG